MADERKPEFEAMMASLDEIVKKLSSPGVSLTDAMALFEQGVHLCGECEKTLTEAEQKILKITSTGIEPFEPRE